ncbi:hypothetical protein HBB04_04145 [Pseudomonas coronafaciens]|nr:hypothetical protein HBB04_04145 [Pseudomonas coronafaciens]
MQIAMLCVQTDYVVQRRHVTQSVTNGVPTRSLGTMVI